MIGSMYQAACWCGWKGPLRRASEAARLDGQDHTRDTGHEPPLPTWEPGCEEVPRFNGPNPGACR